MATASAYINVEDAQRTIGFYEGLGFKTMERHEAENGHLQWGLLDLNGAKLSLGEIAANDDEGFRAWVEDGALGTGVILSFLVDDAEAIFEKAQAIEAEIEMALNDHMGTPSFTLNDPDGYVVSFIQDEA